MMVIRKNSRDPLDLKNKIEMAVVAIVLLFTALAFPYILHILGFFS